MKNYNCKLLDSKLGGYSKIDVNMCMLISIASDLVNVIQKLIVVHRWILQRYSS